MKFKRHWNWEHIADLCERCMWYTQGDSKSYEKMLGFIQTHKPSDCNISKVALNIYNHSSKIDGRSVELIAHLIGSQVFMVLDPEPKDY